MPTAFASLAISNNRRRWRGGFVSEARRLAAPRLAPPVATGR
jgi:hypothetical protein